MLEFIKTFNRHFLREYGLMFTIESALNHLGLDVYSVVKYPITGIKVEVRPNRFWKELEKGRWEFNCFKLVSNITSEGNTVLDVGAYQGHYTMLFSKLTKISGRVYAFEPDPKAYNILRDNIERNHLTNVHVENLALSNSFGKAKLSAYQFGEGESSLVRCKQRNGLRETIVETTTIDKYCEDNGIVPNGIKIDVEGAEGLVLEGSRNIMRKYSPWVLLEYHGNLMSEKERRTNWDKIVNSMNKVVFIDGNSSQYPYGSRIKSLPDCLRFHVFMK